MKVAYPRLSKTALWTWVIGTFFYSIFFILSSYITSLSYDAINIKEHNIFRYIAGMLMVIGLFTLVPMIVSFLFIMVVKLLAKAIYGLYDDFLEQPRRELYYFLILFGLIALLFLILLIFLMPLSLLGLPYLVAACIIYYILTRKNVPLKTYKLPDAKQALNVE